MAVTWNSITPVTGDILQYGEVRYGGGALATFLPETDSLSISADHGHTWVAMSIAGLSPATNYIHNLDYAGGYWFLYAVEAAAPHNRYLYRSADLTTWSTGALVGGGNSSSRHHSVAKGATHFVFVDSDNAGGGIAAPIIQTSTDGLTWGAATFPGHNTALFSAMYLGGGVFVAIGGNGYVYRSTDDGLTWSAATVGTRAWTRGAYDSAHGIVLMAGFDSGQPLEVHSSTDGGATWAVCTLPDTYTDATPYELESAGGVALMTIYWLGAMYALSSPDGGSTWTQQIPPGGAMAGFDGLAYDDVLGGFVAEDDMPAVWLATSAVPAPAPIAPTPPWGAPPDHEAEGAALFITQYQRQPKLAAYLTSFLAQVQILEQVFDDILAIVTNLAGQGGEQLDLVGRIVGQPRNSVDDATYLLWLQARLLANRSSGRGDEILACLRLLYPTGVHALYESPPMTLTVEASPLTVAAADKLAGILATMRAGGVRLGLVYAADDANTFRWATGTTEEASTTQGWGNLAGTTGGVWAGLKEV